MCEAAIARVLSFCIFWDRHLRNRSRVMAHEKLLLLSACVFSTQTRLVPGRKQERLREQRFFVLGLPVFIRRQQRSKYRVALLVDEFFGGWGTAIGGYGALARKYICRFIPNEDLEIDLVLDILGGFTVQHQRVDQTMICRLPAHRLLRQRWLDQRGYDLFLSIEMTEVSFRIISEYKSDTRLLYWIQDPRALSIYQPRRASVTIIQDNDWSYISDVSRWMHQPSTRKRVSFISQGSSLSAIARQMYQIPESTPINDVPNPVEFDRNYRLNVPQKENKIIFLGRLEAQKRVWIFCEIAKVMPQYQFYVLGATGVGRDEAANARTLAPYRNNDGSSRIANLHFTGHVDGAAKSAHIMTAKLLLNTSIWEGIPVSWLEALSYGTLLVTCFDRDDIVARFGTFVGEVDGDGLDAPTLARFSLAIEYWMMTHDAERQAVALKAIEFIRARHSIDAFVRNLRASILHEILRESDSGAAMSPAVVT